MLVIKLRMEDSEDIKQIYSDFEMELGFTINILEEAIEYIEEDLYVNYAEMIIEMFQEQVNQVSDNKKYVTGLYKLGSNVFEDINYAVNFINEVNNSKLNPMVEFLNICRNNNIEDCHDNVINQLNDTKVRTGIINGGMKKGAISELYDILPLESLKFENYFSENTNVKSSYNKFTDYLKTTYSMNNLSSRKELYV